MKNTLFENDEVVITAIEYPNHADIRDVFRDSWTQDKTFLQFVNRMSVYSHPICKYAVEALTDVRERTTTVSVERQIQILCEAIIKKFDERLAVSE